MTPENWEALFWTLTFVTGFSGWCAVMGWVADWIHRLTDTQ